MKLNWLRKVSSVFLAVTLIAGMLVTVNVSAAAENIEIIFTDVTQDNQSTLQGEAKIKVSVKGAGGSVTAVQTALKFDGNLNYKSIEFLQGSNNPPRCFHVAPNTALVNIEKKLLPGIVTNRTGSLKLTDEVTDLFIITFAGNPGDSVTVSINNDSAAGTYCSVDGRYINQASGTDVSKTITASSVANEGINAVVKLVMDKVDDFTVSTGSGYADSMITLKITNEETGSVISTVLNTVSNTKGGHYDSGSSVPTFIVENTVVSGASYTVELSGSGYIPYKKTGVTFDDALELTNADFIPGDVNSDGKVNADDKLAYEELKSGKYDNYEIDYADFNRDGKVDEYDDVFEGIEIESKDVPSKMDAPSVAGGKGKIVINWNKSGDKNVTGYVVEYGTNSSKPEKSVEVSADAVSKEITSLSAGTTYYVRIAAKNANGTGEFSDIVSAKTDAESSDGSSSGVGGGSSSGGGGGSSSGGGGGSSSGGGSGSSVGDNTSSSEDPVVDNPSHEPENNEPSEDEIFVDLEGHVWAKDYVYHLYNKGIIKGTSENEYSPANNIKRGDFMLILSNMLGIKDEFTENFADVPEDKYYYNAIGSAKVAGVAAGVAAEDGTLYFNPEESITRQDLITLAYRAFLSRGYITEADDYTVLEQFGDAWDISEYAVYAMASMVSAGIISGSDGNVNPKGYATRAEVAVMCAKLDALIK